MPGVINGFQGGDDVVLADSGQHDQQHARQEASIGDASHCPPPQNPAGSPLMELALVTAGFVCG